MTTVRFLAFFSGVLFGIWPLLMNRSGLSGHLSAGIFAGMAFLAVVPYMIWGGFTFPPGTDLRFAVLGGLLGGMGLILFNTMLSQTPKDKVGMMFVFMIMVQISVPVIFSMIQTGDYSPKKIVGIVAAFVAAVLLA